MSDTLQLDAAVARLDQVTTYLNSAHMQARILEAVQDGVVRANSPWLDRRAAAAHACCSPSEVDRAANVGAIKRYFRGGTPLFKRQEIDAAIQNGKWPRRSAKEAGQ